MAHNITKVAKELFEKNLNSGGFASFILKHVKLIAAENGHCKAELTLAQEHLNINGTLHGGMTSSLVDVISNLALITQKKYIRVASIGIHVTFLKAAFLGEVLLIDAKTVRAGKTIAFLNMEFSNRDGAIIAQGQHIVYLSNFS